MNEILENNIFENNIFENTDFLNRIEQIRYGKNKILEIMRNIKAEYKEQNAPLNIDVFICILDKMIDRMSVCSPYSSGLYRFSVDLWNNHVFKSKKNFDLLISYEGICF